jgi:hypothetical protein
MLARIAVVLAGLLAALPAKATELKPEEARRFVAGKVFAFTCFEGTRGAGRIHFDGSVSGSIQFRGQGPVRHVRLPKGTLQVKGEAVCASLKGMYFEPCFNVVKTDHVSFRGSVSGLGFAYCDFTRRTVRSNFLSARSRTQLRGTQSADRGATGSN